MLGLIKKLREKNKEIEKLSEEVYEGYATINSLRIRERILEMTIEDLEKKLDKNEEEWQDKYSALYEKYLTLLERYEDVLKGKT